KLGSKLVYASSGAVYGDAPSPQSIWASEKPKNAYGFSKFMMDKIASNHCATNPSAHVVGLRYFNVYGKSEYFKGKTASMVLQFGLQMLKSGSARLFEGSDKICRDFVYIRDIVGANEAALKAKSGVYNAATGKARSFESIVDILAEVLNINVKKEYIPNPFIGAYQFHTQADLSKNANLEFLAKWSLEAGIADYADEIKEIFKKEQNA
ncbi:MAG: NAD-dependent epimerase/dehydratase family protein, partial [Campylobacter sp.]|nr:NAD-dependent epimerase/dehydratase family protein [Campylobacter sp.]